MIILIYGIFALVTNLIGEKGFTDECQGDTFCEFKKEASDENKIDPKTNELVQLWLGFGFCFIWIITLRFIKYLGREKNRLVDERLRSASDYAIKI